MDKKVFLKDKCMILLFGWECTPLWYKVAHFIELFIMDAFVDLFITLCIVVNTVFMALEHDDMHATLSSTLKYGNYVRMKLLMKLKIIVVSIKYLIIRCNQIYKHSV